jgi:hypothetical protein
MYLCIINSVKTKPELIMYMKNIQIISCNNSSTLDLTAPRGFPSYAWYRIYNTGVKESMYITDREILNMTREDLKLQIRNPIL